MLLPLLAQNLGMAGGAVVQPETRVGGGGMIIPRREPKRGWRDPLYLTADLQADLTAEEVPAYLRDDREEVEIAAEVIEEAVSFVGGGLTPMAGALLKLPDPPQPVADRVMSLGIVNDWTDVIAAIKEAHRRSRDRAERKRIMAYRVRVEAVRREVERARQDEDEVEFLMAEGWL
jgi:hypothetical protein